MPFAPTARIRRVIAGAAALALVAVAAVVVWPERAGHRTQDFMITVPTGPGGSERVTLDATLYLPDSASERRPVPAILLAHGFGGSKRSVAEDAADYADLGYAVLTWSAQGFGRSTGRIHLDSPDWEVSDARRLVDWLAARRDIAEQAPGDPRVAAVGGSYGGALALLLAAADQRVDAIVPMITWNDLARSFLPEATGRPPTDGVFKRQWAGLFFGAAAGAAGQADLDPRCGRFASDVCDAYLRIAAAGRADDAAGAEAVALLRRSSPASVIDRITAPTLLIQGTADSLFPLSEADANAAGIAANGTPVQVAWYTGGHDGGTGPASDMDRLRDLTGQWLDHYLRGAADRSAAPPTRGFTYSRITGYSATERGVVTSSYSVPGYPGTGGDATAATGTGTRVRARTVTGSVAGPVQRVANPPGGTPAAMSSLPGAGRLASFVTGTVTEVAGQHADFVSQPLRTAVDVVGAPTVRIRAASATGEAVLFVKLYDVDEHGESTLPDGLVAPVRLTGLPTAAATGAPDGAAPRTPDDTAPRTPDGAAPGASDGAAPDGLAGPVTVTLPAIVHRFEAGHRLRITVASSDQAYATPSQPTVYAVAAEPAVTLPTVAGRPIAGRGVFWRNVLAVMVGLIIVGVVGAVVVGRRRYRGAARAAVGEHADTPLVVRELRKEYADGFVAVSRVDFTVPRERVVGLLGPNGAGKTTALRAVMGLTRPTSGEVLIFGHRVTPGAAALVRVGALVEGPGFLPHLSGISNLRLYWRATGRPEAQAHLDEVLEIAGLGTAVHRKVKTYSHGMKQRLAIAQAMLGLPELLVLDEPTDGLDPPQIAGMRRVLRRYATDGRAVLVSSHLLAEVEQTCTDVVVMHKGRVVAAGAVDEVVGDTPTVQFDVSDAAAASAVFERLGAVRSVAVEGSTTLVADLDGVPRADLVAALVREGIGVDRVAPRRRLEDAFLALVGGDTTASGER